MFVVAVVGKDATPLLWEDNGNQVVYGTAVLLHSERDRVTFLPSILTDLGRGSEGWGSGYWA